MRRPCRTPRLWGSLAGGWCLWGSLGSNARRRREAACGVRRRLLLLNRSSDLLEARARSSLLQRVGQLLPAGSRSGRRSACPCFGELREASPGSARRNASGSEALALRHQEQIRTCVPSLRHRWRHFVSIGFQTQRARTPLPNPTCLHNSAEHFRVAPHTCKSHQCAIVRSPA